MSPIKGGRSTRLSSVSGGAMTPTPAECPTVTCKVLASDTNPTNCTCDHTLDGKT